MRRSSVLFAFCGGAAGMSAGMGACASQGGLAWVDGMVDPGQEGTARPTEVRPLTQAPPPPSDPAMAGFPPLPEVACDGGDCSGEAIQLSDYGTGPRAVIDSLPADLFRNTYYDFPVEGAGAKDAAVFDASCKEIAKVTRDFHDRVCVQGSGKLSTGSTVSFAKRGCDCAALCPRTGHKICFEALDPAKFPNGRGAMGKPITPLRTIAVDSAIIPLGTAVYVADFVGMPRPDGTKHDGCFVAEDRGTRVIGRQIDVFTGDPAVTVQWNKLVPSNKGVRVSLNDAKCKKP